jgi:tetratricopeptide (TPR) repeat protein
MRGDEATSACRRLAASRKNGHEEFIHGRKVEEMIRRAAIRVARRHGHAHAAADARQLSLELGGDAGETPLAAVAEPETAREADPATKPAIVIDATEHLARAAEERASVLARVAKAADSMTASQWFDLACELEAESPGEARHAYHRALGLEPAMADAHINLGRLYHEASELDKAEAHYRAAAQYAPADPIVWFNLGVLLEDSKRPNEALHAYQMAIERDPEYADSHYNLGLLFDALGNRPQAMAHLMDARRLYRAGGTN